ncbi:MAG TPA: PKD domain-containing protein, partial [Phycisphaerae bacterium]|nr:PKD domain-containing protein [Phycisphaerae bacterium]
MKEPVHKSSLFSLPSRSLIVRLSFGLLLLAAVRRATAETLPDGFAFRRPLTFRQITSDAPGDNIAVAEFFANGSQKADGSDFRVTTADRFIMPHKVLQSSKDNDYVRIAFATRSDGPYYVWWGNPKAEKPAKDLEVRRGIYLEVFHNDGRAGRGGGGVNAIDLPPGLPIGAFVMPEVNLGFNPAGDAQQIVMHYTAQFKIDRPITSQMAFTVNDLGILSIDGKEVDRELKSGLRGQVRESFPVELSAGWHTLDIKQVNQAAPNVVMALAWQQPGAKAFTPLPITIIAQAARATAGPLEKIGSAYTPDFTVEATAEGFLPPSFYSQRYTFEAQYPQTIRPNITWDFGDGQSYPGLRKVSHIYLSPATYAVTLKLDGVAGGALSTTVRLPVRDRMYEKFPRPTEDNAQTLRAVLQDYKPEKLSPEQAFRGMMFFESADDAAGQIAWGRAWLAGKDSVPPADAAVFEEACAIARLQIEQKKYKDAAETFKLAAAKNIGMEVRTNLMRHEVMVLCDHADDAGAAVEEATQWARKFAAGNKPLTQSQQEALAYALIAKGDGKAAKAAIDAAAAAAAMTLTGDAYNRQQIRQGVLTRNVEEYIRTKDFATAGELLNQWELEFPAALW